MTKPYVHTISVLPDDLIAGDVITGKIGDRFQVEREHVDEDGDPCCMFIHTDCCDEPRPQCQTCTGTDSNGTPDVVACNWGEGCNHDRYWYLESLGGN